MRRENIKAVVFDLGGVLVRLGDVPIFPWLGGHNSAVSESLRDFLHAFERGNITRKEFVMMSKRLLGLDISDEDFERRFREWLPCAYDGVEDLINDLRKSFEVCILSNTNSLHWERVTADMGFSNLVDYEFLSFKTGLMKPEPEAFRMVAEKLRIQPSEILYFDDSEENVRSAQQVGIQAYCADGVDDVVLVLADLGLLEV